MSRSHNICQGHSLYFTEKVLSKSKNDLYEFEHWAVNYFVSKEKISEQRSKITINIKHIPKTQDYICRSSDG